MPLMPDAMGNPQEASLIKPSVEKPSITPDFKSSAADFINSGADTSTHDTLKAIPTISESDEKLPDTITPPSKQLSESEAFDKSIQDKKTTMGEEVTRSNTLDENARADAVSDSIHLQATESSPQTPPQVESTPFPNIDTSNGTTPIDTSSEIPTIDTASAVKTASNEIKNANSTTHSESRHMGEATWKNGAQNESIKVKSYLTDSSGRTFVEIEGKDIIIPLEQISFPEPNQKNPSQITEAKSNDNTRAGQEEQAATEGQTLTTNETETTTPNSRENQKTENINSTEARTVLDNEKATLIESLKQSPDAIKRARVEEINKELKDLTTNSEELRKSGVEKLAQGLEPTNEERAALDGEEIPDIDAKTPEELTEQTNQELDKLKSDYTEKLRIGEDPTEALISYNKKLAESQGFTINPAEEKNTRELMQGIFGSQEGKSPRETIRSQLIKEKFIELGQIERQLLSMAEIVKKMEKQEKKMKTDTNKAENDYLAETNDAEKIRKLNIWHGKAQGLESYQNAIKDQKAVGRELSIEKRQVAGYIHRKLGTKSLVSNVMFGAGTAVRQGGVAIANSYDSIFDIS